MKISRMPANLKIHLAASGGDFFRAGTAPVFQRGNETPPPAHPVSGSPCVRVQDWRCTGLGRQRLELWTAHVVW